MRKNIVVHSTVDNTWDNVPFQFRGTFSGFSSDATEIAWGDPPRISILHRDNGISYGAIEAFYNFWYLFSLYIVADIFHMTGEKNVLLVSI